MRATIFNLAMVMDRVARVLPACLYGLGCGILIVKLFSLSSRIPAWWLASLAGIVLAAWVVVTLFRKASWFSPDYARAWLDLKNHAGGRIISGDVDPSAALVRPGLWPGYLTRRLLLPAAFVLAALVVPEPAAREGISGASLERALARLERQIDQAGEDGTLAEPDTEALRRQVERLRELSAANPEAAAEALSMLPRRIEEAGERRMEAMADAVDKAAEALREMEKAKAGQADPGQPEQGMAELFNSLDRLAKTEGGLENLPRDLREALESALQESGASSLKDMSGGLPGGEGMSPETLQRIMDNLGQSGRDMAGREQYSAEGTGGSGQALSSLEDALDRLENQQTGQGGDGGEFGGGGIDRGPGEAPLAFGKESEQAEKRFEHRPLPLGDPSLPVQTLTRERIVPSETLPPEEFRHSQRTAGGVSEQIYAGSGGTGLAPSRARAAERYFNNLEKKGD